MNIRNPIFISALGVTALVLGLAGAYTMINSQPDGEPLWNENVDSMEADLPTKIKEKGAYHSIDVTYPTLIVFPVSSHSEAGKKAEKTMKVWVDQNIAQFKSYVKENEAAIADFIARGEEVPASFSAMELTVTYEKKRSLKTLTYLFISASYTGGAHGITVPVTFTFDKTTGTQIHLKDLFVADSDYLTRLSGIARAELPSVIGEYADPAFITDGTIPTESNFSTFYLEGDRIVFLFAPYQVGPYVLGTVTFPVELSKLNDVLKPEYRVN